MQGTRRWSGDKKQERVKGRKRGGDKPTERSGVSQMFGERVLGRAAIDRHLEKASVAVVANMQNSFLNMVS